jgi:hypothetical protein
MTTDLEVPSDAPENLALARSESAPPEQYHHPEITPAQARVESVAAVLHAAYARASTLQLTPEESKALMAEFDDSDIRSGARGDDRLIYLEHAAVRRRLMEVFGPGQWTIINRRSWLDEAAGWLYADIVRVCRGCFVGECIGANRYSAKNARTNYADAVKGAESDALGRIAGTALGVGLQLWSKGFCDGWHQRQRAPQNNQRPQTTQEPRQYQKPAPQANQERKPATSADVLPQAATPKRRDDVVAYLAKTFGAEAMGTFYASRQWDTNWPLGQVPANNTDLAKLVEEIKLFNAAPPEPEQMSTVDTATDNILPESIAESIITVPRRGMKRDEYLQNPDTIGGLYRAMKDGDADAGKRLWGLARGWSPEPYVSPKDGKKYPVSKEDAQCRIDLDTFCDWYDNNHDKEEGANE